MPMTMHQFKVLRFMELAGQKPPNYIRDLTPEERVMRAKLIFEEVVREMIGTGLGVTITPASGRDIASPSSGLTFAANSRPAMPSCAENT